MLGAGRGRGREFPSRLPTEHRKETNVVGLNLRPGD